MKIRTKQINFINWVLTEEERGIIIRSIVDAVGKFVQYFFLLIVFELLFGSVAIFFECFISENILV